MAGFQVTLHGRFWVITEAPRESDDIGRERELSHYLCQFRGTRQPFLKNQEEPSVN